MHITLFQYITATVHMYHLLIIPTGREYCMKQQSYRLSIESGNCLLTLSGVFVTTYLDSTIWRIFVFENI